eukprot:GHVU01085554.1.p1 GENE.GHVU01085554.1~~GHVU01085554.1.p1  ORF type:complete len:107 (-),score=24.29 GHVU01085554.1:151-471(-)
MHVVGIAIGPPAGYRSNSSGSFDCSRGGNTSGGSDTIGAPLVPPATAAVPEQYRRDGLHRIVAQTKTGGGAPRSSVLLILDFVFVERVWQTRVEEKREKEKDMLAY